MGNKVITGVCMRHDSLDVEDFSSADFDFISVAVRSGSACTTPSSRAAVPAAKMMVAVVPINLSLSLNSSSHHQSSSSFDKVSVKPNASQTSTTTAATRSPPTPTTDDEPELSFNDRLNMLTWDPEDFTLPTKGTKRQDALRTPEASIFKPILSTSRRPETTSPEPAQLKRKTPFGWLSRAISNYKSSPSAAKKQAKDLQKKTKQQQQDEQDKQQQQQQKEKMFKTQASSIKIQATTTTSVNYDQDQDQDQAAVQPVKQLKHDDNDDADCEDPISDTESESNATELSFCSDDSKYSTSSSPSSMFAMAYGFLRKEPSSDSIGSCETFKDDDSDDNQASIAYFSSANAPNIKMRDFLCNCGSCPLYSEIEREVTTSTCWMNERERQSICHILQAYSTYNEAVGFSKAVISYAEECLLVFHGDESAAFNAFVLLRQKKWE